MTRIAVDPRRHVGRLDRNVFGGFVEHLGRCIYGGLYEPGSPRADEHGFRTDVLDLLRQLRPGVLRWPGGNFVSHYHWADGIGPASERPRRPELAWGNEESNQFGTDEFLAYCAELGTEPVICLNMGTGTLEEALAWIEYCNGSGDTYWANRRRENGHEQPYGVRYWGLGNEMYGDWQVGALTADEYVREATRWARAIRMLDPQAELVACGKTGWEDWDATVIEGLAALVDYYSIHLYTGSDDYWTNVLQPLQAERAIRTAGALIDRAAHNQGIAKRPGIAYDEWNVWFRTHDGFLEERYNTADALAVATYLNIFVRNCDHVTMANLAQMVNAIAPIVTTPEGAAVQPIFYPVLLHAQAALDFGADVHVDGPATEYRFDPALSRWPYRVDDLGPFTLIDASASVDADHSQVAVILVNRDPGQAQEAEVVLRDASFGPAATIRTFTGPDQPGQTKPDENRPGENTPGESGGSLHESTATPDGSVLTLTLPPASVTAVLAPITTASITGA